MAKVRIWSDTGLLVESWDEGMCMSYAIPPGNEFHLDVGARLIIEPVRGKTLVPGNLLSEPYVEPEAAAVKRPGLKVVK